MSADVFDEIKSRLSVPDVAVFYGIPAERGGMSKCPSHDDRTPSAKIYPERLYCFTCGRGWDAVGLVGELFGLRPIDAARRLSDDFALDLFPDKPPTASERKQAREAQAERERGTARLKDFDGWENWACGVVADYLRRLDSWKRDYAPQSPESEPHELFIETCHNLEKWEWLYMEVFVNGDFVTRTRFYKEYAGEVSELERRFNAGAEAGIA